MREAVEVGIGIAVVGALGWVIYRGFRWLAERLVAQDVVRVKLATERQQLRVQLRDWFQWNVSVNGEKGTAGGNIKLDFPVESGLVLGLGCLGMALYGRVLTQYVVPAVFLCFAFYHFRRWVLSLRTLERALEARARATNPPGDDVVVYTEEEARFGVARCLADATRAFWRSPVRLTAVAAVASVLSAVTFLGGLGLASAGLYVAAHDALAQRRPVTLRTAFGGFGKFGRVTYLGLLKVICVGVLTMLGVIPGLVLATFWMYSIHFVMEDDMGVHEAIGASIDMVKGSFFKNFAILMVALVLVAVGFLVPYAGLVLGPACAAFGFLFVSTSFLRQRAMPTVRTRVSAQAAA